MPKTLNITGPINNLSYGNVCCNLVNELNKLGVSVNLRCIDKPSSIDSYLVNSIKKSLDNKLNPEHPHLIIWHHNGLKQFKIENCKNIGFPIFETDSFNSKDIENFESMDKILVTCKWYQEILKRHIKQEVLVNNLGVNNNIFKQSFDNCNEDLNILTIGKWEIRKGHEILPIILKKSITSPVNIKLHLLTKNKFLSEKENVAWLKYYEDNLKYKGVTIIQHDLPTHAEVASLIKSCDIGIFPSKAEGWNMGLHEMLACGKTCLVSNFSAHTEYCNKENSYLIGNNLQTESCFDGQWFFGHGNWMKFTDELINEWADILKKVIYNKERINPYKVSNSVSHLTWENSAKQLIKNIYG